MIEWIAALKSLRPEMEPCAICGEPIRKGWQRHSTHVRVGGQWQHMRWCPTPGCIRAAHEGIVHYDEGGAFRVTPPTPAPGNHGDA